MSKKVWMATLSLAVLALTASPALASAQDGAATGPNELTYLGVAVAIGMALAAFGGALGQGRATSAAVEAVARQPEAGGRIQTMMIIGLALIETLVLYTLLIAFVLNGKL